MIAFTCLGLSAALTSSARAEEKPKKKPDPAKIFAKKDANGDGSITLEEMKSGMKGKQLENVEKRFEKIDKDGNGKVSLEEFEAAIGQQKKKK
jgi:Ca2+-binding EF-hand superfamily protein